MPALDFDETLEAHEGSGDEDNDDGAGLRANDPSVVAVDLFDTAEIAGIAGKFG